MRPVSMAVKAKPLNIDFNGIVRQNILRNLTVGELSAKTTEADQDVMSKKSIAQYKINL